MTPEIMKEIQEAILPAVRKAGKRHGVDLSIWNDAVMGYMIIKCPESKLTKIREAVE